MDSTTPGRPHRAHKPTEAELRFALLNDWQRDFPLHVRPFDHIGAQYGVSGETVIRTLNLLHGEGAITRVGGAFNIGAGGAGLLCAMAVPADDLAHVAARVSRAPEVNHNYERLHRLNLWFVVTAGSAARANRVADEIAADTGLDVLRMPMRQAFRIDLGFDLRDRSAPTTTLVPATHVVPMALRPLAAQLEQGLPLVARPYEALGQRCDKREGDVLRVLETWVHDGTLRRLGVIVRHHELGWTHNAMTVFEVPADQVEARGRRLAAFRGVTLCYEREPAPGWPYNLYAMVHGQSRAEVEATITTATIEAGLAGTPREILFSNRRFKQTGSRYFAEALA
jgi:DNA-binding Lrp family transcriptional regulator